MAQRGTLEMIIKLNEASQRSFNMKYSDTVLSSFNSYELTENQEPVKGSQSEKLTTK